MQLRQVHFGAEDLSNSLIKRGEDLACSGWQGAARKVVEPRQPAEPVEDLS